VVALQDESRLPTWILDELRAAGHRRRDRRGLPRNRVARFEPARVRRHNRPAGSFL
jgi:hypothetical protein